MDRPVESKDAKLPSAAADQKNDEELSKLLDSSLQEFGKPSATPDPSAVDAGSALAGASLTFDKEAADQAALEFQTMIKQLSEMQKIMLDQMQNVTALDGSQAPGSEGDQAAAASPIFGAGPEEAQFAEAFMKNMNFLAEKAKSIQGAGNEDDLENAIRQLQSDTEYENEFLPFMQGLMSSLLSKDTLYPTLKEMAEKYPTWLEENRQKVDTQNLERYETQLRLIKEACKEFEEEKDDDPDDVKGQRFEKLIVIMQKMQACGHPPEDLVGPLPAGWSVDEQTGIPHVIDQSRAAENCSLM